MLSRQVKGILVSCALLLCAVQANAQVGEARNSLAVGFTGGVMMNTIGFDPTIKQNQHIGPTFGVVARYTSERYFKSYCALQVELNYSVLGWRENILNSNSEPLPDTYERNIHYIQLPMLARLAWGKERRGAMGYFLAGPQIGYCLSEKSKQSTFTLNDEGNPDRPNGLYSQYSMSIDRKFDYGITAGAGVELNTSLGHFLLEGRYYYGLSDVFNNSKKDVFGRSNNSTIVAKVTYLFDVKK